MYVFLHIAKTGGTSIRFAFKKHDDYTLEVNEKNLLKEWNERYKYIVGHLYYGVHEKIGIPCKYVTMLRDPVRRTISHYHDLRRRKKDPNSLLANSCCGVGEFLEKSELLRDYQTKIISGSETDFSFDMAAENLGKCVVVGKTEKFQNFLGELKNELGIDLDYFIANRGDYSAETPKEDLEIIKYYTQQDQKLYELF